MAVDKDLIIVMTTIDEAKDQMPEGKYLETCDALRRIHKKLRRPSIHIQPKYGYQSPRRYYFYSRELYMF